MVRAHDPLSPGEIFDGVPYVRKLPVDDGRHLITGVEQHVLRAEVALHEHRALHRLAPRPTEVQLLQPSRHPSNLLEDRHRLPLEQFLTRYARQITDHDPAVVVLKEGWHWEPARQHLERPNLLLSRSCASGPRYRL